MDCNYSVFASLFGGVLRKSRLWVLLRSRADSIPIERGPSPLSLCNPSAPQLPFPLWVAAINFCVFRITFPSGEEWSVKSNLRNAGATDTQLRGIQLCQWQIIFWPLSLKPVWMSLCHCCSLLSLSFLPPFSVLFNILQQFECQGQNCWGAPRFERQHDFLCCSFSWLIIVCFFFFCTGFFFCPLHKGPKTCET